MHFMSVMSCSIVNVTVTVLNCSLIKKKKKRPPNSPKASLQAQALPLEVPHAQDLHRPQTRYPLCTREARACLNNHPLKEWAEIHPNTPSRAPQQPLHAHAEGELAEGKGGRPQLAKHSPRGRGDVGNSPARHQPI